MLCYVICFYEIIDFRGNISILFDDLAIHVDQ